MSKKIPRVPQKFCMNLWVCKRSKFHRNNIYCDRKIITPRHSSQYNTKPSQHFICIGKYQGNKSNKNEVTVSVVLFHYKPGVHKYCTYFHILHFPLHSFAREKIGDMQGRSLREETMQPCSVQVAHVLQLLAQ